MVNPGRSQQRRRRRNGNYTISFVLLVLSRDQATSFTFNGLVVTRIRNTENPVSFLCMTQESSVKAAVSQRQDNDEEGHSLYEAFDEPLTPASFNMDLQNLASENARYAQDALELMEERYRAEQLNHQHKPNATSNSTTLYIKPNAASYTAVIDGWLHSSDDQAAKNAELLLDRMESIYNETKDESMRPNAVSYMLVCQALSEDRSDMQTGVSVERAERILGKMKERNIVPNVQVYTSVLNAWCRLSGRVRGAMRHAERLLAEMETANATTIHEDHDSPPYRSKRDSLSPNVITYTSVIGGYARSKGPDSAEKAEAVLERMERNEAEPDMVAYTAVINAWAKTKNRNERMVAASRAMTLLGRMEQLYANERYHMKPSTITYSTCINAIANSIAPNAAELAEKVLRHMYDLHKTETIVGIKPTTANFNALINAFARIKSREGRRDAQKAESILVEMVQRARDGEVNVKPDVQTWSGIMMAWAESGERDAAENVQRVLEDFEQLYKMGQSPIRPNVVCYTTAMRAWGNSQQPDAVDRVEAILKRMEQLFEETGDDDFKPNAISYVTILNAFQRRAGKSLDAAHRAQETVDRMMRLYAKDNSYQRPSRIVLNSLINCWSRSDEKGAALQAEKIFKWMEAQYQAGDEYVRPDHVTFCGVLNAWANHARSGGAHRAQQLLDHMEEITLQERGFQLTIICYNIVIKAWARSGERDAIQRAERILEKLEKGQRSSTHDVHPDVTTYSSVINCAAYQKGDEETRREAFNVAMKTYRKLRERERPNHVTYGTLFKAITNLTPGDSVRTELVKSVFEQCCSDGEMDSFVLVQVRNACSAQLYRKLLGLPNKRTIGDESVAAVLKSMPRKWSRNVADQDN